MGLESFSDLLQKVRAKPALLSLFAVTAWSLWYQRNKSRLQKNSLPLHNIVGFTKDYLHKVRDLESTSSYRHWVVPWRSLPLATGLVKTNYDGAMHGESDKAGIGVVIWNSEGHVLTTLSELIVKPPKVEILELLAARWAVKFIAKSSYAQFVYEGDSESVVNSLRGKGMENSQEGYLIKDIMS